MPYLWPRSSGDYTFDESHSDNDPTAVGNLKKSVKKFSLTIKDDGLHITYDGGSFVAERMLDKEGRQESDRIYFVHNGDDVTVSVTRWYDGSLEVEYDDFSGKDMVTYWGYYNQDKK